MKFLETINFDWIEFLNFFDRPFRSKFIPSKTFKDLDRFKNDKRGLVNYCKKWRTRIVFDEDSSWKYVALGGEYDPENHRCVVYIHSKKSFEEYEFTDVAWAHFKRSFIQTLMHELIHFMQFTRRDDRWAEYNIPYKKSKNPKKEYEREYLSNFDEINAYAHDVYIEIKNSGRKLDFKSLIVPILNKKTTCPSNSLRYYLKTFDSSPKEHKALQKLFDQINKWERKYNKYIKTCN